MTIGEKIQYYRKSAGLSQEELGQKLLLSRQTVSLWEKGQTVPTIDNLLKLKEIFGVSVDELLGCENLPQENTPVPSEKYSFSYDEAELSEISKFMRTSVIRRPIAIGILYITALILCFVTDVSAGITGFFVGAFLISFSIWFRAIRLYIKSMKISFKKILESTYNLDIFDGMFNMSVSQKGEIVRTYKCNMENIERIQDIRNYYILTVVKV